MDIKTYGPAKLLIKNNVRILELRGTEEEMAFQHGTLLAQDIQKGPIPYLSKKTSASSKSCFEIHGLGV